MNKDEGESPICFINQYIIIMETIELKFVGIDDWNRPVFMSKSKHFYGDVNQLFSYGADFETVTKKVQPFHLCYFGSHFGCEPMGTPLRNKVVPKIKLVKSFTN
jgi:hypothetical protein